MSTAEDIAWRVEMLSQRLPPPRNSHPDEIAACLHSVTLGVVDTQGNAHVDVARAIIAGVCALWPEANRPDSGAISKSAVWATRALSIENCSPKGELGPLASRIEAAIAGQLVSVCWPWVSVGGLTQALMPGSITMIVGTPGASKSFLLLQAALYWLSEGWPIALYELEENTAFWLGRALAQLAACGPLTNPEWIQEHPDISREYLKRHGPALANLAGCLQTAPAKGATLESLAEWVESQAKLKRRIIMADPLTAAAEGSGKPWESANRFMQRVKRAAVESGASLIFTTHGKKRDANAKGPPDLDSLAGGSAYARFASCVLWLESPSEASFEMVMDQHGSERHVHVNRRLRILKAREGRGTGMVLGCEFLGESLTMIEHGVIIKNHQHQPANASHQADRLRQRPNPSEDVFNQEQDET